jgi:hypothetical protein
LTEASTPVLSIFEQQALDLSHAIHSFIAWWWACSHPDVNVAGGVGAATNVSSTS